jgi:uncharacterized protein YpiB (UPF0302 family)
LDIEFRKQFGNLNKYQQLDGAVVGSKIDIHVAVLLDEIDHAVARKDHYTVKMLERRIRDVKIGSRAAKSVSGSTTASQIAPDS